MPRAEESIATTPPLIELCNVTLRAGGVDTFHDTSLAIRAGTLWGIAGPTGSGKSLLLEAIAGHVPTSDGEILYSLGRQARPSVDYPEHAIGMVTPAQHRALASQALDFLQARWSPRAGKDTLTVRRLLRRHAPRASRAELQKALSAMGIAHLSERDLAALSNGEFRRALFARALAGRPRVLLLDDPFAGLDVANRAHLHQIIASFVGRGNAVVMSLPRAADLPPGITHLICVEQGRVAYDGEFNGRQYRKAMHALPRQKVGPSLGEKMPRIVSVREHAPLGEPLVEMRRVTVRYDKSTALRAIDWCVRAGEKWALRGPNGAGKTTLTNLLLGDHPQGYANEIYLFGARRGSGESIWDIKQRIGWMAPELQYMFPGDVPVFDVICSGMRDTLGIHFAPTRTERTRVNAWLRYLQIAPLARRAFGTLSDGEQRLVLLARSLVKGASLLVLDEPSQGLDSAHRAILHRVINALAREKSLTMILITHVEDDLPRGLTHELRLERGRAAFNGPLPRVRV